MKCSYPIFLGVVLSAFISLPLIGAAQVVGHLRGQIDSSGNCPLDKCASVEDAQASQVAVLDALVQELPPFPGRRPCFEGVREGIFEVAHNLIGIPLNGSSSHGVELRDGKFWIEGCRVGADGVDCLSSLRARHLCKENEMHIFGCLRPGCTCSARWKEGWESVVTRVSADAQTCVVLSSYGLGKELHALKSLAAHQIPLQSVVLIDPVYASLAQTIMPEPERAVSTERILAIMQQLGWRGHSSFQALNSPEIMYKQGARVLPALFRAIVAEKAALQLASWGKRMGVPVYVYDNPASYVAECEQNVMPPVDIFLNTSCASDEVDIEPLIFKVLRAASRDCVSFRLAQ